MKPQKLAFEEIFGTRKMERKLDTKLMQAFGEETFTFNGKIGGGTTSRRPDWFRRCTGVNLLIELDQHQHKSYDNDDETVRLTEQMHDFNRNESENKPMVVIRFNTDEYIKVTGSVFTVQWSSEKNVNVNLYEIRKGVASLPFYNF